MAKKKSPEEGTEATKTSPSKKKQKAPTTPTTEVKPKRARAKKSIPAEVELQEAETVTETVVPQKADPVKEKPLELFRIERNGEYSEPMSYSDALDVLLEEIDKITLPSRSKQIQTVIEIEQPIEEDDEDDELIQSILRRHGLDDESVEAYVSEMTKSRKEIEKYNVTDMSEEEFNAFFDDLVGEHIG